MILHLRPFVSDSQRSLIVNCHLSKRLNNNVYCEVGTSILRTSDSNELQDAQVQCTISYEYKIIYQILLYYLSLSW